MTRQNAHQLSDVPPREAWFALDSTEALTRLQSSPRGLPDPEAQERLSSWGPNRLPRDRPTPWWVILRDQFRSVVMALLAGAVAVSWLTGDTLEAIAIGVVIILNAAIGFATELRARRAILALATLQPDIATVMRDGTPREISAEHLVPGDVVVLEEGHRVPADLRLLEAEGLQVDEAILTGESAPVVKDPTATVAPGAGLHDQATMAFQGTAVVAGSARGLVSATGSDTAVGHIGQLLTSTKPEDTPLERKLDALGHRLIGLTVAVTALVVSIGWLRGLDATQTVKTGIALAVAAIPEGLPAIATIALAVGVRRMARRNALVRRLPSVETLGSVTVVCTDKTGTLTLGRMSVARTWTLSPSAETTLMEAGVMANRVAATGAHDGKSGRSDPTEMALVAHALDAGIDVRGLHASRPLVNEIPFTAARRMMASLHGTSAGPRWFAKGAPEAILAICSHIEGESGPEELTADLRARARAGYDALADDGLRVLAFAASGPAGPAPRPLQASPDPTPSGLTLLGVVGLIDPPAPGVEETVRQFAEAGIRVVMLTGDHPLTAAAVGRAVGIGEHDSAAVDLSERHGDGEQPLRQLMATNRVFARVSPEQKLSVVDALQESGEIVAMLGDGVNDAAALKRADVGVVMGQRGAEVARQASDIVLQDDRFESVGAAIAEGRVVFANIRRFTFYLFSCNLAEVLVLLAAGLMGWPIPLLPLQILWLNMVTDTLPALALAFEPAEEDLMRRPPRPPSTPILARTDVRGIVVYAGAITAVTLVACFIGLQGEPEGGPHTMALTFTTLALAQVFHLGNARGRRPVLSPSRVTANGFALVGAGSSIALLWVAVSFEWTRNILSVSALDLRDWGLVIGLAVIPAVLGQAAKAIQHRGAPPS